MRSQNAVALALCLCLSRHVWCIAPLYGPYCTLPGPPPAKHIPILIAEFPCFCTISVSALPLLCLYPASALHQFIQLKVWTFDSILIKTLPENYLALVYSSRAGHPNAETDAEVASAMSGARLLYHSSTSFRPRFRFSLLLLLLFCWNYSASAPTHALYNHTQSLLSILIPRRAPIRTARHVPVLPRPLHLTPLAPLQRRTGQTARSYRCLTLGSAVAVTAAALASSSTLLTPYRVASGISGRPRWECG